MSGTVYLKLLHLFAESFRFKEVCERTISQLETSLGRAPRVDLAGGLYHGLNRGNAKNPIFFKDEDYEAFERIVVEGLEKFPVDLFSYQWMNNHWHMMLSPHEDGAMGAFLGWVTLTHTQRYHAHHGTTGWGHVYQGRFKSFPIQDDDHFLVACRYVERNALTANLVKKAENYRWGSLANWLDGKSKIELSKWPTRRSPNWVARVNQALTHKEIQAIHRCEARGRPFGDDKWVETTVKKHGLESTIRAQGRPKKKQK
ncbi:MAG: putative transposase [Mariniblastus sp.]